MLNIAVDTETFLIGAPAPDTPGVDIYPDVVCMSSAWRDSNNPALISKALHVPWEHDLFDIFVGYTKIPDTHFWFANAAFDERVLCRHDKRFIHLFWELHVEGRIHDVQINEKLNLVARSGHVNMARMPDGSMVPIKHNLAELEKRHIGRDRSADKGDQAWRMNYNKLFNWPLVEWPGKAVAYALEDAEGTLLVAEAQGLRPATSDLRAASSFALAGMTLNGIGTDAQVFYALKSTVEEQMDARNFPLLVGEGIMTPATAPREYANGAKEHDAECGDPKTCDCPPKMTSGTKESIKQIPLKMAVLEAASRAGLDVPLTDTGKQLYREQTGEKAMALAPGDPWWSTNPKTITTAKGFLSELAPHCTIIEEYEKRQQWAKLKSTYIPALEHKESDPRYGQLAERVHFAFDVVKETGRTSSYAANLYPSTNGQNMDPRMRPCFRAAHGHVILSWDYSSLELVTLAQTCLDLFGFSRMAELINAGVDLHTYLGAQLAYAMDNDFYAAATKAHPHGPSAMENYEILLAMKKHDPKFYKHWRTFAKPVGLGFPGGLGAKTMVQFAWAAYKIRTCEEDCRRMREVWLATYPEMVRYFEHVNQECIDGTNERLDDDGNPKQSYKYTTPLGMVRSGAHYTAACNGLGMQSPAAEGATLGVCLVVRACEDQSLGSILYGCKPFGFVHDEILLEVPYDADPARATAIAEEVEKLMLQGMRYIVKDVRVSGEPAFSRNWFKQAEPEWQDGILLPWDEVNPEAAQAALQLAA